MTTHPMDLAARISAACHQFAAVRQRFDQAGAERGGCPRAGVTPVYVSKFGAHAATIFPNLTTVEALFDADQLGDHQQCVQAAQGLVEQHQIVFVPSLQEEVSMIPDNLVSHFTSFVHTKTMQLIQEYTKQ